jgi:hypothetical protein
VKRSRDSLAVQLGASGAGKPLSILACDPEGEKLVSEKAELAAGLVAMSFVAAI